ncbi:MAG: hypothetical protein HYV35_08390 [Lentisphaerae bacterium]|nr:hypothetical protein [Lentisphaerota bacterium]
MISCTEFIAAYNELFKFIDRRYGKKAVLKFWEGISDNFLGNLEKLVRQKGIQGMKQYWRHTLAEEAAYYRIKAGKNKFKIELAQCPSIGLLRKKKIKVYKDYCRHCDTLYRRIIEKYGFDYTINYLDEKKGECRLEVTRRQK